MMTWMKRWLWYHEDGSLLDVLIFLVLMAAAVFAVAGKLQGEG